MRTKGIGPQSLGIPNVSPLKMVDEPQGPGDKKIKPGNKPKASKPMTPVGPTGPKNRSGNKPKAGKPMTPTGPTGPKNRSKR